MAITQTIIVRYVVTIIIILSGCYYYYYYYYCHHHPRGRHKKGRRDVHSLLHRNKDSTEIIL